MALIDERYRYGQRLFNIYVAAVGSPLYDMRNKTYAALMEELLKAHLETNFVGRRLGMERKLTKEMLKEIVQNRKNPEKFRLSYIGPDAERLTKIDEMIWEEKRQRWRDEEDQAISIRSTETELKSLRLAGRLIKSMEGFSRLKVSDRDDAYLYRVANLLLEIIQNNGYEIDPINGKVIKTTTIIHF